MINNHRVIRAYLSRVSAPVEITPGQAAEIVDILKNDAYGLWEYVRKNNIDVRGRAYTELLLQHVKSKAIYRDFVKAGLAPGVSEFIKATPSLFHKYIDKGWLSPEDPGVKQVLLEEIKAFPGFASKAYQYYVSNYIDMGWLKPEDPEVKQALLEIIKKTPGYARDFTDRGWLTQDEVDDVLGSGWDD